MLQIDTELDVYKRRHSWTNEQLCDVLGIGDTAFRSKRKGRSPFSARELKIVADLLGVSMEEAYEMLPEINH